MAASDTPNGPSGEWTLAHDEQWDVSLDESPHWEYGQIDDEINMPDDDGVWSSDHVFTENGQLIWQVESDGDDTTGVSEGVINSASTGAASHHPSEGIPVDPTAGSGGVYLEASMDFIPHQQDGLLAGFWTMPSSQNWPGELDIVEHETTGAWVESQDPEHVMHMTYHWATTGTCGDYQNPGFGAQLHESSDNLSTGQHTYGIAWYAESQDDSDTMLEWFLDGVSVREVTFGDATQAVVDTLYSDACIPHGIQFSCHINRGNITGADLSSPWTLENSCDWLRVWHLGESDSGSEPIDSGVPIGGTFTNEAGTPLSDAVITVLDDDDDPPTVIGTTTTDSQGNWSIGVASGTTVHCLAEWGDGTGTTYRTESKPFIAVESGLPEPVGSPIHWWPMDEGSGSTLADNAGSNLVSLNGPVWSATDDAVGGYSVDFDGSDDYGEYTTPIDAPLTVAASVYLRTPGETNNHTLVSSQYDWTANEGWYFKIANSSAEFFSGDSLVGAWNSSVSTETWTRIAATYDASGPVSIYYDAVEQTSGDVGTYSRGTQNGYIGVQSGNSNYLNGFLDDIVIYDSLLSLQDLQADYERQPWS